LGFYDTEQYKDFSKKCAEELSWSYDELLGESRLIIDFLEGNWNSEDFLIVQPGERMVASHDDRILEVKNDKSSIRKRRKKID